MKMWMIVLVSAAYAVVQSAGAQSTNEVTPGPDGLIHLEAKPEMVDLVPSFAVASVQRSVDFYVKGLGFAVVLQSGNYVAVGRDAIQLGLVQDKNAGKGYKPTCYIRMVRIDDFYNELMKRGVKLATPIKTQASQMREFSVADPDGYILIFGEYVGGS